MPSNINSRKKRTKPQVEWADPNVPEYASDVDSRASERAHNVAGAVAASTGQAGLDDGNAHKVKLK